jgi:hypothetical protein
MKKISYGGYRFPPEIIQQAIWLYLRFTLSLRDVEDLLAERDIMLSYESIRRWVIHFGPMIAADLRRRRPRPHTTWHLDEVYLKIDGRMVYLWRAVDAEGEILDVLVQPKRDKHAALKLMRKLLNNVTGLWAMQVAELKSGRASSPPALRSIRDPHVYVWSMRDPMAPVLAERISMKSRRGSHWLTFDIEGKYAYVAPNKSSDEATEIFDAHTHKSLGLIGSSEDMIEIDFVDGKVSRVGDQYGIGRVVRTSTN